MMLPIHPRARLVSLEFRKVWPALSTLNCLVALSFSVVQLFSESALAEPAAAAAEPSSTQASPAAAWQPPAGNAVSGAAAADPNYGRTSSTNDALALMGHVGLGAPAGLVGVDVDLMPIDYFALEVGVGANTYGLQWAVTPRLRIPLRPKHTYLGFGLGYSQGEYKTDSRTGGLLFALHSMGEDKPAKIWNTARWLNYEASFDRFTDKGRGLMRLAGGFAVLQNRSSYTCDEADVARLGVQCDANVLSSVLYFVFSYGFSI